MNHRTWKMEICYSTPLTELRNEHNALCADWKQSSLEVERLAKANGDLCDKIAELESRPVLTWEECEKEWMRLRGSMEDGVPIQNRKFLAWLQSRLPAPIRVPFSDEVIEKMAEAAQQDLWGAATTWPDAIRAALAAGGLEPCAAPQYAPEDVAFKPERASDEELREIGVDAYLSHDTAKRENAGCMVGPMQAATAAVRSRVEAPLLAEIRHLRSKLASAHQKTERQAAELTKLYHLRQGDAGERARLEQELATERDKANRFDATAQGLSEIVDGQKRDKDSLLNLLVRVTYERDTLRAQLDAVTAERESLVRALVEAKRQRDELASKFIAKNPSEPVYGGWHFEDGYKIVQNGEPSNNAGELPTPTDAQVEALAKAMHAKTRFIGWNEMLDVGRESWRNSARAAYDHIGRVPVAWELDVTWQEMLSIWSSNTSSKDGMEAIRDLCRSRITPVYECKECAEMEEELRLAHRKEELVRAALEGE